MRKPNRYVPPHIGRRGSTTLDASRKARQRNYHVHRGATGQPVKSKDTKITNSRHVLSGDESPEKFSVYQRLRRFDRDNKGFITHHDLRMVTSELGHELTEEEIVDMADSTCTAKKSREVEASETTKNVGNRASSYSSQEPANVPTLANMRRRSSSARPVMDSESKKPPRPTSSSSSI